MYNLNISGTAPADSSAEDTIRDAFKEYVDGAIESDGITVADFTASDGTVTSLLPAAPGPYADLDAATEGLEDAVSKLDPALLDDPTVRALLTAAGAVEAAVEALDPSLVLPSSPLTPSSDVAMFGNAADGSIQVTNPTTGETADLPTNADGHAVAL